MIPIAGMIVGNSMNVASVTAVRLLEDARAQARRRSRRPSRSGASPRQSTSGLVRRSVRLAMVPVIDSTKTMGIVFLPGAMTGMILAGANPLDAVRLQVVVMFMLLAAVSLTATLVAWRWPPAACSRRSSSCGGSRATSRNTKGGGAAVAAPPPRLRLSACV